MSDDLWLRELAQVKRDEEEEERARLDERWDRLSAGELSPDEEAELRALAESSEEAGEAYEAFRPLGPDFHARVVKAVSARRARVLPFPARLGAWLSAAAAVAAMLVVFLRSPGPLPDYAALDLSGGSKAVRGGEAQAGSFAPGDRIQVGLRPETDLSKAGKLAARCVLVRGDEARLLDLRTEIDPGGAVKMDGHLDDGLAAGDWTLWAVVGRPGKLPETSELRTFPAVEVRTDDWTAIPTSIRVRPRALR